MNKGIEILLARMESNPDEFLTGNKSGKWLHLMESFEDHMLPEERKVLMDKYNALKMEKFTERVLKEVLEDQQEKSNQFGEIYQQQYAAQQRSAMSNAAAAMNQAGALGTNSLRQYTLGNGVSNAVLSNATTGAQLNSMQHPTTIRIGEQTLTMTDKTIKKLKALLK